MNERSQTFRSLMIAAVAATPETSPVLLSGGVDSATIVASSLALGRVPPCYTFQLGGSISPDLTVTRQMASTFGLPLTVTTIPWTAETLDADVRRVLRITRNPTKTHVQCAHPFLYMAAAIAQDGHRACLMGMAADDLYGTMRDVQVALHAEGEAVARQMRTEHFFDPKVSDWSCSAVARHYGVVLIDPYRDERVAAFVLGLDMAKIHRRRQKALALAAFPEFWSQGAWVRPNASLQVVSGLRAWHNSLLSSPVNRRRSVAVRGVYTDFMADVEKEDRT